MTTPDPTPAQVLLARLDEAIDYRCNSGYCPDEDALNLLFDAANLIRAQAAALAEREAECERLRAARHNNFGRTFLCADDYDALLKVYMFAIQSSGNGSARIMAFTDLTEKQLHQLDALTYDWEARQALTPTQEAQ